MSKKPSISTITSGYTSTTALNANFEALRDGFDNTLSLDGSTPNAMNADFDMNSNDILNAKEVNASSLRLDGVLVSASSLNAAGATLYSDNYTGDGSTVSYTMSYQPFIKDNTQVYIDGVYQNKAGYETSGTTLTFSEAPPLNSNIEIVVARSLAVAGTSSANVDYNQGGTGAVTTTVENKLQEFVSVKDFGAVGDGVTDDIDAIIAAHATGKHVLYEADKTYYVEPSIGDLSKVIEIKEHQQVNWNGCRILCTNGAKAIYYVDCRQNSPKFSTSHLAGLDFRNVRIATNRTGHGYTTVDFEHFIYVEGGFLMASCFTNFSGEPYLSCTSIIYFDLTYVDPSAGVQTPGVVDYVYITNMGFLNSNGVSAVVLVDGSSAGTPTIFGGVTFENIVCSLQNKVDYDDRTSSTGKNGAVIFDTTSCHGAAFRRIFGLGRTIQFLNGSSCEVATFETIYAECVNPASPNQCLIFADGTSKLENCIMNNLRLYALPSSFGPSYDYRFIDAAAYNCRIVEPHFQSNNNTFSEIPSDVIKLSSGSYGNVIDKLFVFGQQYGSQGDASQKKITVPSGNVVLSYNDPIFKNNTTLSSVAASATETAFVIDQDEIEFKDTHKIEAFVDGAGSQFALKLAGAATFGTNNVSITGKTKIVLEWIFKNTNSKRETASASTFVTLTVIDSTSTFTNSWSSVSVARDTDATWSIFNNGSSTLNIISLNYSVNRGSFVNFT